MRPLNSERGSHVAYTSLGNVIWAVGNGCQFNCRLVHPGMRLLQVDLRLRLGHVDNRARHAANHDHAAAALALHEVTGDRGSKEKGTVHVDGPQLAHAVDGIVDGLEILGKASRGDEVVNLAVSLDDLGNTGFDGCRVADVGVVSGDFGDAVTTSVMLWCRLGIGRHTAGRWGSPS